MIVAAGLTPAWQQILSFDRFMPGEVCRARQAVWCGSGKVLNVGANLHALGAESVTLCPVGGLTGQQIRGDFAARGIPARWLETKSPTRVCTTILDGAAGTTTELVENSSSLTSDELSAYLTVFEEVARPAEWVVLSGSLPQGTPVDFYRRLIERTSARVILDGRGPELQAMLPLKPFLVKPNREELGMTVGRPLKSESEITEAMDELRSSGAEWVVVTNGPGVVLALGPDGLHRYEPTPVKVVNPIGCGDALTSALAWALSQKASPTEAIQYGIAQASEKAGRLMPHF